ncbi:hypothetical protein [Streptomyces nanshensis]|uniref:Uncharacterized protein n=1 Tax=Streptomyces nanshensis TaxID=518642 RepID=A0A1E7L2Z2_9ACTN|nr:hypothetical protein [Streptomyces nanshensis]OEV10542.1 hypothetical protein AN218_16920 [Streptomyces nanshensis]
MPHTHARKDDRAAAPTPAGTDDAMTKALLLDELQQRIPLDGPHLADRHLLDADEHTTYPLPGVPHTREQEITACAHAALAAAGRDQEALRSVSPAGRRFFVRLADPAAAKTCTAAWTADGYRVVNAPSLLGAAAAAADERPPGEVELRVEPPLQLPDGPYRPTRLTDQQLRDLRERARREAGPFVDPALVVPKFHSIEWAEAIAGYTLEKLDWPTTYLLHLGLKAEPEPPTIPGQQASREKHAQHAATVRAATAERHNEREEEDTRRWRDLAEACPVELDVRENLNSPARRRDGRSIGPLRHATPRTDAVSPRRLHPAGRALCEVTRERRLGDPIDQHATCRACWQYASQLQPAST